LIFKGVQTFLKKNLINSSKFHLQKQNTPSSFN
jgi:hypothetical protein